MNVSDFERDELWALAQLFKRLTWDDFIEKAQHEFEAETMNAAIIKMSKVLAEIGYDPR